jgi:hypothetical protein
VASIYLNFKNNHYCPLHLRHNIQLIISDNF